ncbi:hypothetical protein EIP91_006020, partial [Steccherinum ochraceum]
HSINFTVYSLNALDLGPARCIWNGDPPVALGATPSARRDSLALLLLDDTKAARSLTQNVNNRPSHLPPQTLELVYDSDDMSIYLIPIDPAHPTLDVGQFGLDSTAKFRVNIWNSVPGNEKGQPPAPTGTSYLFFDFPNDCDVTVLSSLGPDYSQTESTTETGSGSTTKTESAPATDKLNLRKELVRQAIGSGVRKLKTLGESIWGKTVLVDASKDPHAAAVAAHLALYSFDLKTTPASGYTGYQGDSVSLKLKLVPVNLEGEGSRNWEDGVIYATAQNVARTLEELPANLMTPTKFALCVQNIFSDLFQTSKDVHLTTELDDKKDSLHRDSDTTTSVPVQLPDGSTTGSPGTFSHQLDLQVHDKDWVSTTQMMNAFMSVTTGSAEPCKFVEMTYTCTKDTAREPIVLVGEGITFNTGGISLKPADGMKRMRGDMGGAAVVFTTVLAAAQLKLNVNIKALLPLCENMPGQKASKPGDIVYAMNGKSIEIGTTDAAGQLVLADALWYGSKMSTPKPKVVINVASSNGSVGRALGEVYTGVITNSEQLWKDLEKASKEENDLLWRLPLSDKFAPQITAGNADLSNDGGPPASPSTTALFLKSFVFGADDAKTPTPWAHLDIGELRLAAFHFIVEFLLTSILLLSFISPKVSITTVHALSAATHDAHCAGSKRSFVEYPEPGLDAKDSRLKSQDRSTPSHDDVNLECNDLHPITMAYTINTKLRTVITSVDTRIAGMDMFMCIRMGGIQTWRIVAARWETTKSKNRGKREWDIRGMLSILW